MTTYLQGKKILIVGGNGFVGNFIASKFVQNSAQVYCLSRNGPKYSYPQNKSITWLKGDIMHAQQHLKTFQQADTIIHSLGALFDTSITKLKQKGEPGTYQHLNRDTLKSILKYLSSKKQIIYLSSLSNPPFIQRYLSTKHQAEKLLFQSQHQGYSIRPAFIYNYQHRKWSIPLKYMIQLWNIIFPWIHYVVPKNTFLEKFLLNFKQFQPTPLELIGNAVVQIVAQGSSNKIISNEQMKQLNIQRQKAHRS